MYLCYATVWYSHYTIPMVWSSWSWVSDSLHTFTFIFMSYENICLFANNWFFQASFGDTKIRFPVDNFKFPVSLRHVLIVLSSVARWSISYQKYQFFVYFDVPWDWKYRYIFMSIWYILRSSGKFYVLLVYFTFIWYILYPFGTLLVYFCAFWYVVRRQP
jgi:hypothetical protein